MWRFWASAVGVAERLGLDTMTSTPDRAGEPQVRKPWNLRSVDVNDVVDDCAAGDSPSTRLARSTIVERFEPAGQSKPRREDARDSQPSGDHPEPPPFPTADIECFSPPRSVAPMSCPQPASIPERVGPAESPGGPSCRRCGVASGDPCSARAGTAIACTELTDETGSAHTAQWSSDDGSGRSSSLRQPSVVLHARDASGRELHHQDGLGSRSR